MKGVQCYELFGGIALKNHAFFTVNFYVRADQSVAFRSRSLSHMAVIDLFNGTCTLSMKKACGSI